MHHTGVALAKLGYVVICPDSLTFGERQDATKKLQGGNYERFEFLRYLVSGKCLAWKDILDMRRTIDYLVTRPEVKANALGLEKMVRFTGWSEQREVAELMAKADLLVLPSYDEGLPLVILEALANGVAVVCTPVGEIPSALHDGVTACFVEPGDVNGLAEILQNLLRRPDLIATLEKNGKALYDKNFSLTQFFFNIAKIHKRSFGVSGQSALYFPPSKEKTP